MLDASSPSRLMLGSVCLFDACGGSSCGTSFFAISLLLRSLMRWAPSAVKVQSQISIWLEFLGLVRPPSWLYGQLSLSMQFSCTHQAIQYTSHRDACTVKAPSSVWPCCQVMVNSSWIKTICY